MQWFNLFEQAVALGMTSLRVAIAFIALVVIYRVIRWTWRPWNPQKYELYRDSLQKTLPAVIILAAVAADIFVQKRLALLRSFDSFKSGATFQRVHRYKRAMLGTRLVAGNCTEHICFDMSIEKWSLDEEDTAVFSVGGFFPGCFGCCNAFSIPLTLKRNCWLEIDTDLATMRLLVEDRATIWSGLIEKNVSQEELRGFESGSWAGSVKAYRGCGFDDQEVQPFMSIKRLKIEFQQCHHR